MSRRGRSGSGRSGKKRRMSARMRKQIMVRNMVLGGIALFLALIIFGILTLCVHNYVGKMDKSKISNNVYIGNVDVSKMTKKQAKTALKKAVESDGKKQVSIKIGKETAKVSLAELGLKIKNSDQLVKEALRYAKTGSRWGRYFKLRKLKKTPHTVPIRYKLNEKDGVKVLKTACADYEKQAQNATIEKVEGGFKLTDEKSGKAVDKKKAMKKVLGKLNTQWNGKSIAISMKLTTDKPVITKAQLTVITDELGSYATKCEDDGSGRVTNVKTGTAYINGTVLMPGESFSTNDAMKPYTKKRGYTKAGSYENGGVVDTMGGGICQISSTLYNAVLYSELEVTERKPHSMTVGYVEPSRDAAIADETKDFCFKNSTKYPIYIYGKLEDGKESFAIYGKDERDKDRTVEFESETLTTEDGGVKYVQDPEANVGSWVTETYGHTGKTAQLWKIVKENGKQVSKDVINQSSYAATPVVILVGTKTSSGTSSAVQSAIESQDESTIKSAISKEQ